MALEMKVVSSEGELRWKVRLRAKTSYPVWVCDLVESGVPRGPFASMLCDTPVRPRVLFSLHSMSHRRPLESAED